MAINTQPDRADAWAAGWRWSRQHRPIVTPMASSPRKCEFISAGKSVGGSVGAQSRKREIHQQFQ
jgi:hypothetical protein